MRKNLVICPCSDDSLHKEWFVGERTFDILVLYYGNDLTKICNTYDFCIPSKGLKYELATKVLVPHFKQNPDFYAKYEYFWFPDSDLKISATDIDRMFRLAATRGAEIFTPSIANDLYPEQFDLGKVWASWDQLKTNPKMQYRRITHPESMMPGFSAAAYKDVFIESLILFPFYRAGWGLETVWHALSYSKNKLAPVPHFVFDDVHVLHTKPVGEGSTTIHEIGQRELGMYYNPNIPCISTCTLEEFPYP